MSDPGPVSTLFRHIETLHGDRPWGSFLDAGTGRKSLEWIVTLPTERWAALTAAGNMKRTLEASLGGAFRPQDRLLLGNWQDESLFAHEVFDVVLMDYLIGAVEGFTPYWQDRLFHRVRPHVGGRLYITAVEPYVPYAPRTESERLVWEIGRLRDACMLLAGERPYREFPVDWVLRHLGQAGFRIVDVRHFPIRYRAKFVNGQLDMCLRRLPHLPDPDLAQALRGQVEALRAAALPVADSKAGLKAGADYVIAAEPLDDAHWRRPPPAQETARDDT
ncbi:class I SAM-dependent methyltransferase [Yunchengibacter salinarum]|uniref:class I SAM-dependent methyltransferase n=1 Tax=Yunchengibacter salinarum TaxID=3133399 RepID=UPI0035B5975C